MAFGLMLLLLQSGKILETGLNFLARPKITALLNLHRAVIQIYHKEANMEHYYYSIQIIHGTFELRYFLFLKLSSSLRHNFTERPLQNISEFVQTTCHEGCKFSFPAGCSSIPKPNLTSEFPSLSVIQSN